jgi:hypothetical protein
MKYLIAPALLALALAAPASAESRNLAGFDSVNASDPMEIEVAIGPQFAVDVSGREAGRVRTWLQGRQLHVAENNRPWFGPDRHIDAVVHITMPSIEALSAARGATLTAHNVQAGNIDLAAAMGGELHIDGVCQSVDASAAMGGSLHAEDLRCARADASAAMGGEMRLNVSDSYDASAAMGGSIDITGKGARGHVSAVMGGEVHQN